MVYCCRDLSEAIRRFCIEFWYAAAAAAAAAAATGRIEASPVFEAERISMSERYCSIYFSIAIAFSVQFGMNH